MELITNDNHEILLKRLQKKPLEYHPDIVHHTLLQLLDSPLNKAKKLQIYINTCNNVLIYVSPHIVIPKSFKNFANMMVQLLHKFKITSNDNSEPLLKIIKNPITDHIPIGSTKFAITSNIDNIINFKECIKHLDNKSGYTVAITCNPNGICSVPWSDISINISQFLCSTCTLCTKVTSTFEEKLGIL